MAAGDTGQNIQDVASTYEGITKGYNELDAMRKENYDLTQGGESWRSEGGQVTRGTGPPGTVVTIGTPPGGIGRGGNLQSSGSQITRPGRGGGGGGGGSRFGGYIPGPTMDRPELKRAEFEKPDALKYDEYKPPEQDPAVEKQLRQEYMAPGMRQVRQSTQQAIISSRSFDNPNARSMFIQKALEGVGSAVSKIAGTAGREATGEARLQYRDELDKYHKGFQIGMEETRSNWDSAWDTAMMMFQEQSKQNAMEYQQGMSVYGQQSAGQQIEGYNQSTAGMSPSRLKLQEKLDKMYG